MVEAQDVIKVGINQEAIFRFREYYDFAYNMIKARGFDIVEDSFNRTDEDVVFHWSCTRRIDPYVEYLLKIEQKMLGMKSVKVNIGGINEPMNKARVNITIRGIAVTSWEIQYTRNDPKWKFLKGFIDKYFFKQTIDTKKGALKDEVFFIENEMKSFFDLKKFV